MSEQNLRQAMIDHMRYMNALGINQGTSGNLSIRQKDVMFITPSGVPYDDMEPDHIAVMPLNGEYGVWMGDYRPSTEWRFHYDILQQKPDVQSVVHLHPTFCTVLSIAHMSIPACHYMIAAFGGDTVPCTDYHTYGTQDLSNSIITALADRWACLIANHGSIALGETLDKAVWRAVELETLAKQYYYSLALGNRTILPSDEIVRVLESFKTYGLQSETKVLS